MVQQLGITVLNAGYCVEVYKTGGLEDGLLAGYAIHFSGSWDGYWKLQSGDMRRVALATTRQVALEKIAEYSSGQLTYAEPLATTVDMQDRK